MSNPISPYQAGLSFENLRRMARVVRILHRMSRNPDYRNYIGNDLPATARFDPGHHSVMMGYDFHIDAFGPRLIEVNTNAGGIWYASLAASPGAEAFPERLGNRLLRTFAEDYALFRKTAGTYPASIAIIDEHPEQQMLFPEMWMFKKLFEKAGIGVMIADPQTVERGRDGLYLDGKRIDMIYNRHCDFYLQTSELDNIRKAWLSGAVCLSPNPHTYGLLADKRRMVLWSKAEVMRNFGLTPCEQALLAETVPETRLLDSLSIEKAWQTRKKWVFKPDSGYASRGVYVGEKITRTKFAELDRENTVVQARIPPSITYGDGKEAFKTDYRLFVYGDRIVCLSSRLYQGQVTNLRTENGGFAAVILIR